MASENAQWGSLEQDSTVPRLPKEHLLHWCIFGSFLPIEERIDMFMDITCGHSPDLDTSELRQRPKEALPSGIVCTPKTIKKKIPCTGNRVVRHRKANEGKAYPRRQVLVDQSTSNQTKQEGSDATSFKCALCTMVSPHGLPKAILLCPRKL